MPGGVGGARASLAPTRCEVAAGGNQRQSAMPCGVGASRRPYHALAAPSFTGPLHQPGSGLPAGTDEMCFVRHLLSHGASWRTSKFLGIALQEAALAATRIKNSYLQAQYQRLRPRIGHRRALGAVQHSMLVAYWHMFTNGETYRELGGDYYQRREPERLTRRLIGRLESLGHTVTLQPQSA